MRPLRRFEQLTEIKNLKKKRSFKNISQNEQYAILDKLFYEKVFAKEQEKMLYFFLAYPQQTVLIKVGEKQAEKDFIGYEFSSRRGHEGIKMYRDGKGELTTKLYDEKNYLNCERANSYIYNSFLKIPVGVSENISENVHLIPLVEMMSFKTVEFNKSIGLTPKKKVKINSKWKFVRLYSVISTLESGNRPKGGVSHYKGGVPSLGGGHIGLNGELNLDSLKYVPEEYYEKSERGIIKPNDILICKDGALTGKIAIVPKIMPFDKAMINEHVFILRANQEINQKYIYDLFYSELGQRLLKSKITGQAQGGLNSTNLGNIQIPLPPIAVQEKIIDAIEYIRRQEHDNRQRVKELKYSISYKFDEYDFDERNLGDIVNFKNGLNYRRTSSGDIISIVGVKDFQNNFTPDLTCLDKIQIEGHLKNEYKLLQEDILVVRSNGSANLVGRFLFIKEVLPQTSFSGFTIRLRRKNDQINTKYLCYCLRTDRVREKLTKDSKGSNIKSLNQTLLSSIKVPFPSFSKQEKIIQEIEQIEDEISTIEHELANVDIEKERILKKYLEE